jgi:hypothetical protein
MKKLALAIAFTLAFGVLSLAYGYYRYKKTVPVETSCERCDVSSEVYGLGGPQRCSVSCSKGSIPHCLSAEFGVRPVPECYCSR